MNMIPIGLAQVGAQRDDVGAGHQRGGVGRHHRIDVRVDNARAGGGPLGDLVGVGHVRQAGPEVKKLADTLGDHVVDHPLQQVAALDGGVGAGRDAQSRDHRVGRVGGRPVDGEVVLAAELVVPDAGRVGIADADRVLGDRFGCGRRFGGHRALPPYVERWAR
jgi:hypothetical protein